MLKKHQSNSFDGIFKLLQWFTQVLLILSKQLSSIIRLASNESNAHPRFIQIYGMTLYGLAFN